MKKILVLILTVTAFTNVLLAQDNIILRTGEEIKAKVQEVGVSEIKYKRTDNANGPLYTILKKDVFMIQYENGTKDVFSATQAPVVPQAFQAGTNKPLPYNGDYEKLRVAGKKRIIAGAVLTGLSVPTFFTGIGLATTATSYYDSYPYGGTTYTNDGQLAAGIFLTLAGTAMMVVGPVTLSKGVKYRRMARSVKPAATMNFNPIKDYNLDRYGRAFNQNKVGTISFTF